MTGAGEFSFVGHCGPTRRSYQTCWPLPKLSAALNDRSQNEVVGDLAVFVFAANAFTKSFGLTRMDQDFVDHPDTAKRAIEILNDLIDEFGSFEINTVFARMKRVFQHRRCLSSWYSING